MKIVKMPLERLNPAKYNPRVDLLPDDPDYKKIQRSLRKFGAVLPLVWNERTQNLVGGHQRLKMLRAKGEVEAHVSVVNLSEIDEEKLNIALNNSNGRNDNKRLYELLAKVKDEDPEGFEDTGYDDERMAALLHAGTEEAPEPDGDPDPNSVKATIQLSCPRDMVDEIVQAMTKFTERPGCRLEIL